MQASSRLLQYPGGLSRGPQGPLFFARDRLCDHRMHRFSGKNVATGLDPPPDVVQGCPLS
jgi:hypothetical protein